MKNLKILRKTRGYTQTQLSQFMHIGSGTVCRWELGASKPDLYQILTLCRVLGCSPAQFFDDMHSKIPVFECNGNLYASKDISDELTARDCCFGLVVPHDISHRIREGDICYFSFGDDACEEMLVIATDSNLNGHICLCRDLSDNMQIVAVCRMLQIKI